jgi:hypothetical protein
MRRINKSLFILFLKFRCGLYTHMAYILVNMVPAWCVALTQVNFSFTYTSTLTRDLS